MQYSEELNLIKCAQGGDSHAFRKLVEMHQPFAYSVAFRFTGNAPEAEDIIQEVFIKLWKNLGKYKQGIKLTTWLYQIITNQCLDYLKSASRKHQMKNVEIKLGKQIRDYTNHEQQVDDQELLQVVTGLAKQLTPKQQTVFVLRDLEGLSVEEVCEVLKMSAGKMKSNLYYARQKIRQDLIQYYKESTKQEYNEL
ncbi:MAG TPA: RNA polymerase sigma factor [Chryseolinea sp.]|mgnify:CR=1 FL=1|nr:RNA polymerase sigma factor [Chryseolinea sp.]